MNRSDGGRPVRAGFWAVLLLGIFAWAPAMYPGYWRSLDGFTPIFNAAQPSAIATIATAADFWRGAGSAAFLLVEPFEVLRIDPTTSVRFVFAICLILGGLGVYAWLAPRLGDRPAGLAGLVYMFLPVFLSTIYIRGNLADAQIMGLLPVALAGAAVYSHHHSPSSAGVLVISVLWMWRTQAGIALLATLLLLAYAAFVERHRITLLIVAVSGLAGLVSLIPLFSIQSQSPVEFADHFVYLHQLLVGGWQTAPSIPGWQDAYPFQLGFVALVFSALTLWAWRSADGRREAHSFAPLLTFGFVGAGLILFLSLGASAPLWRLTGAERLLTYPWQIMVLSGVCLAVTAGSLPAVQRNLNCIPYWAVLVTLCLMGSYPYLTAEFLDYRPPSRPVAVYGQQNDLVILEANLVEVQEQSQARLEVAWQVLQPLPVDYNIFLQALAGEGDDLSVVGQLDAQPLGEERAATSWQPGEVLTRTYTVDLSATEARLALEAGGLRYHFGYYDWQDGARLPVDGGIDDKLIFYGN
ncbi:MAG: hypothetical protein HC802_21880 [Caldilineaceae bacterium]|nr:hypothetical protein [Caldilineaceae bacterium]